MQYKIVFWPLIDQTLAVVSNMRESGNDGWETHHTYTLKTLGSVAWPIPAGRWWVGQAGGSLQRR
jgi:hypothetical protein